MGISLVLGFFDGVHKAHRAVIESAFKYSDNVKLVTFKDSPSVYFGRHAEYIMTREESIEKIKSLGVKEVVELNFEEIVNISAEDYLKSLAEKYHPISISTGFNHTFGFNKTGNPEFLKENQARYNYKYLCVEPISDEYEIISSTLIKKYLKEGNIIKANTLLESNFSLSGKVIHGKQIGRTIGFPTANISYPDKIVKIPFGVYEVDCHIHSEKNTLKGIMNWGIKPTVNNTNEPVAEIHILNYQADLYGQKIKAEVLKQIRSEKRFSNIDELKTQIKKDIQECLK